MINVCFGSLWKGSEVGLAQGSSLAGAEEFKIMDLKARIMSFRRAF